MAVLTTALMAFAAPAEEQRREIAFLPGEHWWAGVISQAHRMPFTVETRFEFDFFADTAGNQGQPLLISDQGRYIWCDDPFRFEFDRGVIRLRVDSRSLHLGTNGTSAATAFQQASRSFFPPSGRMPDALLFTRPQFNTWIELTYNQNQADVRNLAKVDQELIVRAAQCHALMPMMQFSVAPWRVLSPENDKLCLAMARLHASMVDEIVALAANSARTGEPIVRPLDYDYPGQGYAMITDEFLLGPSILVAPVLSRAPCSGPCNSRRETGRATMAPWCMARV